MNNNGFDESCDNQINMYAIMHTLVLCLIQRKAFFMQVCATFPYCHMYRYC